ncbi:MAG TPA: endonuclease/exonuclease/phosphatase family protein [Polyangiaceae bacterium]|nr:endonuclease/exonuclease/phosphatase family protein [Polyangiaceae bacterium]
MPPLRILSYNVRYFGHGTRGIASTRSAMKRIAAAVASLDPLPDIVCLQEVETDSIRSTVAHPRTQAGETQLTRLMVMLGEALKAAGRHDTYDAYYFPAHAYQLGPKTQIYTTGLAILTHRDFEVHHHNTEVPADITHRKIHLVRKLKQTRICAHIRFKDRSGHVVDVFNTHLSLPTTFSKAFWTRPARMGYGKNQLEEAKNLIRFVEAERKSDRFFIAGDFNSLPGSPVYQLLLSQKGYADPFAELYRMSERELIAWPTAGFMNLRMHLDHIFAGPAMKWVDFDGTHAFGDRATTFHGLSDHVPLIGRCNVALPRRESHRPRANSRPPE